MNTSGIGPCIRGKLIWLPLALFLLPPARAAAPAEAKFDVLRTRTGSYTNATVTTKARTYICILHQGGICSIKVEDLPPDIGQKLGYFVEPNQKTGATKGTAVTRTLSSVNLPQIEQFKQAFRTHSASGLPPALLDKNVLYTVVALLLLLYAFFCYCCALIVRKTGNEPGILIWLPVLQLVPMLRGAGMSLWWFLAGLVPFLNIVAQIVWCFKITQARGKSVWVAIFLLLPFTNLLAFLYLAFSGNTPNEEKPKPDTSKLMTLETA